MKTTKQLAYKRILLKLSGEALLDQEAVGINATKLAEIAAQIAKVAKLGVQIAIVIGGGNLFRGASLTEGVISRITGDQMGMLATVMNALALRDVISHHHPVNTFSAVAVAGIVDQFERQTVLQALADDHIVIFAAGTGHPLFTTDTAASLRAIEINADILLKATKVDGVYSADPLQNPQAKRFERLTYDDVIQQNLQVMDLSAVCLCRDHQLPLRVFSMTKPNGLMNIVLGQAEGTEVGVTS